MSLAYFPLYPDDFEADTAHLSLAEDGAYNRLLRLCWRSPGCSIPADRQWIYRRMRCLSDEDRAVVDAVLDEFFTTTAGRCSNARLSREFVAASEAHERRKSAGSKGGKAKSLKSNETPASNAVAKPKQPEPEPEPYSSSRARTRDAAALGGEFREGAVPAEPGAVPETAGAVPLESAVSRQPDAVREAPGAAPADTTRERLLAAMGTGPDGVAGPSAFLGTMADMAEAAGWTALGLSVEAQCRVIAEVCRRQRSRRKDWVPSRFAYFTAAMRDAVAVTASPQAGPAEPDIERKRAQWRRIAAQA